MTESLFLGEQMHMHELVKRKTQCLASKKFKCSLELQLTRLTGKLCVETKYTILVILPCETKWYSDSKFDKESKDVQWIVLSDWDEEESNRCKGMRLKYTHTYWREREICCVHHKAGGHFFHTVTSANYRTELSQGENTAFLNSTQSRISPSGQPWFLYRVGSAGTLGGEDVNCLMTACSSCR